MQTGSMLPWTDVFNSMRWNWLAWTSQKPVTEDYVPLFPWLGVMWWGAAADASAPACPCRLGALEPELLPAAPARVDCAGGRYKLALKNVRVCLYAKFAM